MVSSVRSLYARVDRFFPRGFPDVVLQVALFELGYMLYRAVRGWIDGPQGAAIAFEHGRNIIDLERSLGLFIEPKVQDLFGATGLIGDASSWLYLNAQVTITLGALIYIYLRHNGSFYFVRNMFMVSWTIALIGYIVYPTAPPRFFPEWGFIDSVVGLHRRRSDERHRERALQPVRRRAVDARGVRADDRRVAVAAGAGAAPCAGSGPCTRRS